MAWLILALSAFGMYWVWRAPPPTTKQLSRAHKIDRVGRTLVYAFCFGTGAFMTFGGIDNLLTLTETATWKPTSCKVLHANVEVLRDYGPPESGFTSVVRAYHGIDSEILRKEFDRFSDSPGEHFSFDVLYEYSDGGHIYRGRNCGPWHEFSSNSANARESLARLRSGAASQCWVNPRDPSQATFARGGDFTFMIGVAAGIALIFVGGMLAFAELREVRGGAPR